MSQTTPRKYQNQNRGHQSQSSFSRSPHSHSHSHSHSHLHHGHARNRSQQLRVAESQPSTIGASTSDYESDMANYMASQPPPPTAAVLAARTNTELNLSVLRRYRPSITSILSIAANAVVYAFTPPAKWEKSSMEGTLFICAQRDNDEDDEDADDDADDAGAANGCLFILNRRGLQNFTFDLSAVANLEPADELLIFKLEEETAVVPMENGESARPNVLGLWVYAADERDRNLNTALIKEMWTKARAARGERESAATTTDGPSSTTASSSPSDDDGVAAPAMHQTGRQVSMTELFGRSQNGIGGI
ncbi:PH domain-like protein [Hypoxylon sp. FL0543]|nr:PH domain-like protein [Hypoxylon sp. FL0543]